MCTTFTLFIPLLIDIEVTSISSLRFIGLQRAGHDWATELNWTDIFANVNSAAMKIGLHVYLWIMVFSGYLPGVGLVNHMVILFFVFQGTSITFSIVIVSICIPTESATVFPFFHTPSFVVCRFGDDDHSGWCEVIPHCTFHLHFSDN